MGISKDVSSILSKTLSLIQGKKIDAGSTQPTKIVIHLQDLLLRMHRLHLIAPEPDSFLQGGKYSGIDKGGVLRGKTHIHPVSAALRQDAEHLKSICILKGRDVANFEILGLDWEKRQISQSGGGFSTDKVAVLAAGDIVSLYQAMHLISQREQGIEGPPIVIQSTNRLWEETFKPIIKAWERKRKTPQDMGVYFSDGATETADILARLDKAPKINPNNISFQLTSFPEIKNPLYLFATTDHKKFKEVQVGLKSTGTVGRIRTVFDILGKYEVTPEEKYSFEGNAEEKMEALISRIKELGVDTTEKLLSAHGYHDTSEVILMTNDGGLGFCLENDKGQRETNIFTKEFFPDSYHRLNQTQMSPGVELAYLMRTIGLETAMEQLQKSVVSFVRRAKGAFKKEDLRAYDTSLQMFVPLSRVLDAIRNNTPCDLQSLGVVSVFSGERLKVSPEPKGPRDGKVETINYLQVRGSHSVRAEVPEWVAEGPNAKSFRELVAFAGTNKNKRDLEKDLVDASKPIEMGTIFTPSHFFAKSALSHLKNLRGTLREVFKVKTKSTINDWIKYKDSIEDIIKQASSGISNSAFRSGIRSALDKCSVTDKRRSVFYIGEQKDTKSDLHRVLQGLSFFTATVRNQVFNPVNFVVNRSAVPHLMKLIEHKQELGLIGQSTSQLMTVINSEQEAAAAINDIVRSEQRRVTPLARKFSTDNQVENNDCMTVTTYFSASNVNESLIKEARRLGYLIAVNGINLKVGGGNDGLMRAVADGFQNGKKELSDKGYDFPNQLVLVQCVDTESIEKAYDGGGIYRCHPTIEAREADLQNTDFVIAGAGGAGTDEEIFAEFYSRVSGLTNPSRKPMILFNQQVVTKGGISKGVHDPYGEIFTPEFMERTNTKIILTPEEILAHAVSHRAALLREGHIISLKSLRSNMNKAALSEKRFVPSYTMFAGYEGQLPQVANEPEYRQYKVA